MHSNLQWNLSITDTLGPEKRFVIQRFPLFRGYFICTAIYLDPQKQSVIERFPLLGEFVMRGSTVSGPTKVVCCREVFTIGGVCYKRFLCIR